MAQCAPLFAAHDLEHMQRNVSAPSHILMIASQERASEHIISCCICQPCRPSRQLRIKMCRTQCRIQCHIQCQTLRVRTVTSLTCLPFYSSFFPTISDVERGASSLIGVSRRPMSDHMREDEQLEQDPVVAAGEGDEAVLLEPEIPVLHLVPEEEISAVATTALEVRP